MLVNIEGISGAGKTEALSLIQDLINNDCVLLGGFNLSEYSTELTHFCRELTERNHMFKLPVISELHLLLAEIIMDIHYNVSPALLKNQLVIYENYWDSILYYELAIAKVKYSGNANLAESIIGIIDCSAKSFCIPKPDFTIFIDCSVDSAVNRIEKRENIRLARNDIEILKEVQNQYKNNPPTNRFFTLQNESSIENMKWELIHILRRIY